jgi:hypothetical protein
MEKHRIAASVAVAFALTVAPWSESSGAASIRSGLLTVVHGSDVSQSSSPRHLYVLDGGTAIYRFPLAQDGLPAMQPDSALYPEDARDLTGLAVDRAGHVFVADGDKGTVSEFAAGATGQQQPISVLYLGGDGPDRLNIDDAERLYVHYGFNQDIAIFAKGAHGNDAPISIVPPWNTSFVTDYVIALDGTLFVTNYVRPVTVYDDPLQNPSQPSRFIWPDGNFYAYKTTLALDEAMDHLYIQFDPNPEKYWNKVSYDVRPLSGVPSTWFPYIYTGACGQAASVNGTKIIKNYLIVSCNFNPGVVSVYRKGEFGRQRNPVEIVGRGTLCCPFEMAVGP